jgi:hypothetical protein
LRGGSFGYLPWNLRSADRFHDNRGRSNTRMIDSDVAQLQAEALPMSVKTGYNRLRV